MTKRTPSGAIVPIAAFLLVLTGCSSFEVPTTSVIAFSSEPSGAEVFVNGGYHGRTPVSVRLPREIDYAVTFRLAGYLDRSYTFSLRSSVLVGQPRAEITESVHGVLTPSGIPPESTATATSAPRPASSLSPEIMARTRGTIGGKEPEPLKEAKPIYVDKSAPVTVVLTDGKVLAAASVEQAPPDFLKVYLLDGTSKMISKHKIRSVATPGPTDWTRAVLDEGKNVPPR